MGLRENKYARTKTWWSERIIDGGRLVMVDKTKPSRSIIEDIERIKNITYSSQYSNIAI